MCVIKSPDFLKCQKAATQTEEGKLFLLVLAFSGELVVHRSRIHVPDAKLGIHTNSSHLPSHQRAHGLDLQTKL